MFVQRQFQRYQKRSADEQQVSLLLKDFEDADQLLGRIIDASKAWREAWISILTVQHRMLCEYDQLYAPIVGAGEDYVGHVPVETEPQLLQRTNRLKEEYDELKKDLIAELDEVQRQMIDPAQNARENLALVRKSIKKREDKKLDYERYQSRVDSSMKKSRMSDRDRAQLTKAQSDLAVATETYNAADNHLREYLPPLLHAVWSLQPYLLAAQIQIQNSLLAHYYTMLHNYCQDEGFPSPSPPMDEVIRAWDEAFRPAQRNLESCRMIASGKAIRTSFGDKDHAHSHAHNGTNGYRRPSQPGSRGPSISPARPGLSSSPSSSVALEAATAASNRPRLAHSASSNSLLSPHSESAVTTPASSTLYRTPSQGMSASYSPAGPNVDYFSRDRQPSASKSHPTTPGSVTPGGSTSSLIAGLAGKKKPPPPPPPPRIPSHHFQFVTALYDFGGQGDGDLAFREGDKIKVLKKTESTDDWWQGELRGIKGAFPANYVKV